jgi:hypothetical protein
MLRTGPVGIGRRLFASGAIFLGFSLGGSAGGGAFLVVVREMVLGSATWLGSRGRRGRRDVGAGDGTKGYERGFGVVLRQGVDCGSDR